ncbi:MAG TPA: hypothetical protein VEZ14_04835 [Dehalococcoidia bacterium]|nr:hypothetical protein [Dehalococcoidia bacterium]
MNWRSEMSAITDMAVNACAGHLVVAEALWEATATAAVKQKPNGVRDQKILVAKICAEEISALEDIGALAHAVASRRVGGLLRHYLEYKPKEVGRLYRRIRDGALMRQLLDVPDSDLLSGRIDEADLARLDASLAGLDHFFSKAAQNYLELDGALVNTYNKLKHGFSFVQRIDLVVSPASLARGWESRCMS